MGASAGSLPDAANRSSVLGVKTDAQHPRTPTPSSPWRRSRYEVNAPDHSPPASRMLEDRATNGSLQSPVAASSSTTSFGGWARITAIRAAPLPDAVSASAPRERKDFDVCAETTKPGRIGSPARRPRASHAAFAPASSMSRALSSVSGKTPPGLSSSRGAGVLNLQNGPAAQVCTVMPTRRPSPLIWVSHAGPSCL